jgi:hypothetical protein
VLVAAFPNSSSLKKHLSHGAFDAQGQPPEDSITDIPGIYLAGLDLATTRRSGTILASTGGSPYCRHIAKR